MSDVARYGAVLACALILLGMTVSSASAQTITGPADASRVRPNDAIITPKEMRDPGIAPKPEERVATPAPSGAKKIDFVLKGVNISGATAFSDEELKALYADMLEQKITVDALWALADRITTYYRNAGYILSYAEVPEQDIASGVIRIVVTEGGIEAVDCADALCAHDIVKHMTNKVLAEKPINAKTIESYLLRLNDLPDASFRGVLGVTDKAHSGVKLTVLTTKKDARGTLAFDNYGSRFLGPHQASLSYSVSLLPLSKTSVYGLSSLPTQELHFGTLEHTMMVSPELIVGVSAGRTLGAPGYTLAPLDVESVTNSVTANVQYQWLRQRDENLTLKLTADARNSASDILGTALSRDRIRVLRLNANYEGQDGWGGSNTVNFTVSKGITGLGASKKGELNLSRAEAEPDFTKLELSLSRMQKIGDNWQMLASASGQVASGPLYSSEEYGYGGQVFGRAYDSSEITGDHGVAGGAELRYAGWNINNSVSFQPYGFYDIGAAWNEDTGQQGRQSGSSAGLGLKAATRWNQSANLAFAWPLTRDVGTPIYGRTATDPRFMVQFLQEF